MKNAKKVLGLSLILSLSISILPTLAFANNFTTLEEKTTSDSNKSWTITLSNPVNSTSVNSKSVYVMDELNHTVTTKVRLGDSGTTITVVPIRAYTSGEYRLFVTDSVQSQNSANLTNPTILPFSVVLNNASSNNQTNLNQINSNQTNSNTSGNNTTSNTSSNTSSNNQSSNATNNTSQATPSSNLTVNINYNSLVTSVNVNTSDNTVTEIRAKNQPMHYLGGNKYNAGLAGVKRGDSITIDAFDASHKKLYSGKYPVN